MARCKQCGAEIPENMEYCEKCADKLNTAKDSESYLDSLLNAVMTEEPVNREIAFSKREASSPVSVSQKEKKEQPEENTNQEETSFSDFKDYSIFDLDESEEEIDRILAADLQDAETEPFDWLMEEQGAGETAPEAVTEETEELEEISETETAEEKQETAAEEFNDFSDLYAVEEPAEAMLEPAAEPFSEEEPEIWEEAQEADAGLEALLSGLDELTEEPAAEKAEDVAPVVAEAAAGIEDFADLFENLGDDDNSFFEFGAEPGEIEEFTGSQLKDSAHISEGAAVKETGDNETALSGEKKRNRSGFAALFHRLFDNVKVDPSKIKREPTKEELEEKKKAAKEARERAKEEKEALLAEKKAQEQKEKAEKRRLVLEAKAEKKARKLEEAKLLLEEMEGTRINRAGASIVFIFFAMIAVLVVVGTNIFSYSLSIRNARYEFDRDEYTLAYNEIFGLDIKDEEEDIVLYDRIMTVMYVQKQLNSYYNYYEMKDYPKALDSLLKGLQRYEKYIDLAVELDIESDLDSVRSSILAELDASFFMSEQEAMNIIQSDSRLEYSMLVYDAVDEMKLGNDIKAE